ncbi:hypothetical protein [uncultured Arenimonas sp.]|uniref:hypothetical protein n=1 Tax=uncultured Arenimonas sp. TaxID=546226 RepID=UPI0030DC47AB
MTIEVQVRFPLAAAGHPGGYLANIIRVDQPVDAPTTRVSSRRVDRSELRFAIYGGIGLQVAHAETARRWPILVTIEHLNPTVDRCLIVLPRTSDHHADNIEPMRVVPGGAVEIVLQADHDDLLIYEEGHADADSALAEERALDQLLGKDNATALAAITPPLSPSEA